MADCNATHGAEGRKQFGKQNKVELVGNKVDQRELARECKKQWVVDVK